MSIMLPALFPSTDRRRALCCFSVQFPTANPVKFLTHPRQSGVAERQTPGSSTRVLPRSALVLARCPCVVNSLRVIPHVYLLHGTASLTVSPFLSLAETCCHLCSVVISPQAGRVYLQRLPYGVLPLASTYV